MSLDRIASDKMIANRNKCFTQNHKRGDQWSRNSWP